MIRGWRLALTAVLAAASIVGSNFAADAQPQPQKKFVAPKRVGPPPRPQVQRQFQRNQFQRNQVNQFNRNQFKPNVAGPKIAPNVRPYPRGPVPGPNFQAKNRIAPGAKFGMRGIPPRTFGRTFIKGRNYSVWRGGPYRRRYGSGWRTFVALSTLAAISVGAASYYPYAYIDAPADYCQGLTEDGCELRWAEVPTLEGGADFQCVAYCPWQ